MLSYGKVYETLFGELFSGHKNFDTIDLCARIFDQLATLYFFLPILQNEKRNINFCYGSGYPDS